MKKHSVTLIACTLALSTPSFADNGAYIGLDTAISHQTQLEAAGSSVEESSKIGANLFAGYKLKIVDTFHIGFEAEYRKIGEADFSSILKTSADAYYLNVRPVLTATDKSNKLYSAFVFGIGRMKGDVTVSGKSTSHTENSYQIGVEAGYKFDSGIDFALGYRYATADFDSIKIRTSGVTAGIRYNF